MLRAILSSSKLSQLSSPLTLPKGCVKALRFLYRRTGYILTFCIFIFCTYGVVFGVDPSYALPPLCEPAIDSRQKNIYVCEYGNGLSVISIYVAAFWLGEIFELIHLPGLLGMLIAGLLCRLTSELLVDHELFWKSEIKNYHFINGTENTEFKIRIAALLKPDSNVSNVLKRIALATILARAGFSLDPEILKTGAASVLRLAFMPCIFEALANMVISTLLIGWPYSFGSILGFVLAAVSPAVLVPSMIRLEIDGWGIDKGIPTLAMAASSMDDVLAIMCFGISNSMSLATGVVSTVVVKAFRDVVVGIVAGTCFGLVLWVFPVPGMGYSTTFRVLCTVFIMVVMVLGSQQLELHSAGALGCLCLSFTVSMGYRLGYPWRLCSQPVLLEPIEIDSNEVGKTKGGHNSNIPNQKSGSNKLPKGEIRWLYKPTLTHKQRYSLPLPQSRIDKTNFNSEYMDEDQSKGAIIRRYQLLREPSIKEPQDEYSPSRTRFLKMMSELQKNKANINSETDDAFYYGPGPKSRGLACVLEMRDIYAELWFFIQPLLFSLIGTQVDIMRLRNGFAKHGIISMLGGLLVRMAATILAVTPSNLNIREKFFLSMAWLPKATVQAALGSQTLHDCNLDDTQCRNYGEIILGTAVLAILISAPLGAILIPLTGPRLLKQSIRTN